MGIGDGAAQDVPNIGDKDEYVGVPYVFGENTILAHLNTSYYHVHGQSFCYPELANDITVTSGTGAWGTGGAITEIVPAATLTTSAFDMHWININNLSEDAYYFFEIFSGEAGSEVKIGCVRSWRDSSFFGGTTSVGTKRIQVPQQAPGARISAKLYSGNAGTASAEISFEGHYYA